MSTEGHTALTDIVQGLRLYSKVQVIHTTHKHGVNFIALHFRPDGGLIWRGWDCEEDFEHELNKQVAHIAANKGAYGYTPPAVSEVRTVSLSKVDDSAARMVNLKGIVTPHVRMPLAERHHVVITAMVKLGERLFNGEDGESVWNDAMNYIEDRFNNWE